MSYSWRLSSGSGNASSNSNGRDQQTATSQPNLGSNAVDLPLTPPSVRNVTPSTCLSIVQFRALMQEYRSLDDSITTRLNRSLAKARATGETASPSLLSAHATSSNPTTSDLGRSTYGTATHGECARFWKELVDVWTGRDEVLNYCLSVAAQAHAQVSGQPPAGPASVVAFQQQQQQQQQQRETASSGGSDEMRLLDADLPRDVRGVPIQRSSSSNSPTKAPAKTDAFDARDSRSETMPDLVRRQLGNEVSIEAIIRKRSLEVLRSRCRFFEPIFADDDRGRQERKLWEQ